MRRRICVLAVLLSFFGLASAVAAQDSPQQRPSDRQESGFQLGQNYPNPFNPETRIPFVLEDELFDEGRPVRVSLRIYNVLQQFVASPTALGHPGGEGTPVVELEYPSPGEYEAYWDGTDRSGREVASGVYFVQLVVNGESQVRKMFVTK